MDLWCLICKYLCKWVSYKNALHFDIPWGEHTIHYEGALVGSQGGRHRHRVGFQPENKGRALVDERNLLAFLLLQVLESQTLSWEL